MYTRKKYQGQEWSPELQHELDILVKASHPEPVDAVYYFHLWGFTVKWIFVSCRKQFVEYTNQFTGGFNQVNKG